jgi:hypothetical protein
LNCRILVCEETPSKPSERIVELPGRRLPRDMPVAGRRVDRQSHQGRPSKRRLRRVTCRAPFAKSRSQRLILYQVRLITRLTSTAHAPQVRVFLVTGCRSNQTDLVLYRSRRYGLPPTCFPVVDRGDFTSVSGQRSPAHYHPPLG